MKFTKRWYYVPQRNRYYFILDQEAAWSSGSGQFGIQEYKHMDAFRRNFPDIFQGHIITSEDFLREHKKFLVLDYLPYNKECPTKVEGG